MKLTRIAYYSLVYLFLYIPIAILIVYSFNNHSYSTQWHGFTWQWYQTLAHDTDLMAITGHSLIIATLAASVAVIIGFLISISLYRYRFLGRKFLYGLIMVLVLFPDLVMGIAMLLMFHLGQVPFGFISLLLAHISFCLPFVVVTTYGRLVDSDQNLFEAAADLGASEYIIIRRILLPLMLPALIASWLLSFTLSLDDVIISFFISGPTYQILPLKIYSMIRLGVKPEINALCSIMFGLTIAIVISSQKFLLQKVE